MNDKLIALLQKLYFEYDKDKAYKLIDEIMGMFYDIEGKASTYSEAYRNQVKITQAVFADKYKAMEALEDIAYHANLNTKKSSLVKVAKDALESLRKHREKEWQANGITGVDLVKQK